MEGLQAREIERDCVRARRADIGNRRGANEPRGFGENRGDEGGGCIVTAGGKRGGVGRIFPFPDGVEEAGKAGATAVIQPGGSVRDPEVIAAANRMGMAMLFTGIRHFRH